MYHFLFLNPAAYTNSPLQVCVYAHTHCYQSIRHVIIKPENRYSDQNPAYCLVLNHSHRTKSPGLPSGSLPAPKHPATGPLLLSGQSYITQVVLSGGRGSLQPSGQDPPWGHPAWQPLLGKGRQPRTTQSWAIAQTKSSPPSRRL